MSLMIRRNPNRLFNQFFNDPWMGFPLNETSEADITRTLALDVEERDNAYHISAALPGVSEDNIEIRMDNKVLTIVAENHIERNDDEESESGVRTLIQERRYGKFSRRLRFPDATNNDSIEANYVNGVLSITIPKAPEAQPKVIKLNSNNS